MTIHIDTDIAEKCIVNTVYTVTIGDFNIFKKG